ncbi:MAG: hypothetical protein JXC32_09330 [Anaerolineae bacterium]|nr:hypothetical protein [Anaerolineae bacterium]
MIETDTLSELVQELATAIVVGSGRMQDVLRRCHVAGLTIDALRPALLVAEREIIARSAGRRPDGVTKGVADRLAAALGEIDALWPADGGATASSPGTIAVAGLPGEGHSVGRQLWRLLLAAEGYTVRDLGLRAPPIVAREAAALKPDALALNLFDARGRGSLQSLVAGLLRWGAKLPLMLGGPGVDEAFAQGLAIAESTGPYWGGVYYCSDGEEMLQVLEQVVLFEPPPQAHSHEHGVPSPAEDACDSCGGCPLAGACNPPISEDGDGRV